MTNRRITQSLLALLAVGAAGVLFFRLQATADQPEQPRQPEPLVVGTLAATPESSYSRQRRYTGLLKESRRSQLSFQRGGEVTEILVDQGDTVSQGQVLGKLDSRHTRSRQAQLVAQRAEAQALLDELLAGPRPETIAAKRAELRALVARRESLKKQVARRDTLVSDNTVSREEFELFSFDLQANTAEVDRVQSQLDELLAGTRTEQIAAQQARLDQLQAALTEIDHDLEDAVLTAPFSGRIAHRYLDEGTVISSGTPVVELLDDRQLEAWIGLPAEASYQLSVGEKCPLDVAGEQVLAEVQSLSAEVDDTTRTRLVRLRLDPGQPGMLPGQVVRLAIAEQVTESGYWVPTVALTKGTRGLWSLYVVESPDEQAVAARRDVELLDTVGNQSFVRGALQAGDQIISSGAHRIVSGQRVLPQAELVVQAHDEPTTETSPCASPLFIPRDLWLCPHPHR